MASVPAMSVYINSLRYDQKRLQEPFHVSKLYLRQREVDDNGEYTNQPGDMVTVERLMPVPYSLTLKVDIWTSNTEQKLQLLEQIAILFNPSLELQSTDNFVDWTSLSYITLTDTNFSSRSIPVGTEEPIDVATLTFELPIWISAPAKVKKLGVIQKFITSIWDAQGSIDIDKGTFDLENSVLLSKRIYTPVDCNIVYLGNTLRLYLSSNQTPFSQNSDNIGDLYSWPELIKKYGTLTNGISEIRLEQDDITIIGTVSYHPSDESLLIFNPIIDTLPANNLNPINAIINPSNVPVDSTLLNPAVGTRYLILDNIGSNDLTEGAPIWNRPGHDKLIARTNDIIEFNGAFWFVAFDSSEVSTVKYLTNLRTNTQYKWKNNQWTKSVEGRYGAGAWSFVP